MQKIALSILRLWWTDDDSSPGASGVEEEAEDGGGSGGSSWKDLLTDDAVAMAPVEIGEGSSMRGGMTGDGGCNVCCNNQGYYCMLGKLPPKNDRGCTGRMVNQARKQKMGMIHRNIHFLCTFFSYCMYL